MSDLVKTKSEFVQRLMDRILSARGAERDDDGQIHASSVSRCIRQTYYRMSGTPPDVDKNPDDNRINLIYKYGDAIEHVLTEQMQLAGIWRGRRFVHSSELGLVGTTDPVVEFEGKRIVLEIKGTHRGHFHYVMRSYNAQDCEPQYYDQIQTYLHLSPEIEFGVLIVTNRDMRPKDELPPYLGLEIYRDRAWKVKNWKRIKSLRICLDEHTPPPREFDRSSWQCNNCAWRDTDWGDVLMQDDLTTTSTRDASKPTRQAD